MKTSDFISVCLGIGTVDTTIDDICENFDLDISENDVYDALDVFRHNYEGFGDYLIGNLYQQVINKWVKEGLDKDKFDYYTNGMDSHLYYDEEEISCNDDLQEILNKTNKED